MVRRVAFGSRSRGSAGSSGALGGPCASPWKQPTGQQPGARGSGLLDEVQRTLSRDAEGRLLMGEVGSDVKDARRAAVEREQQRVAARGAWEGAAGEAATHAMSAAQAAAPAGAHSRGAGDGGATAHMVTTRGAQGTAGGEPAPTPAGAAPSPTGAAVAPGAVPQPVGRRPSGPPRPWHERGEVAPRRTRQERERRQRAVISEAAAFASLESNVEAVKSSTDVFRLLAAAGDEAFAQERVGRRNSLTGAQGHSALSRAPPRLQLRIAPTVVYSGSGYGNKVYFTDASGHVRRASDVKGASLEAVLLHSTITPLKTVKAVDAELGAPDGAAQQMLWPSLVLKTKGGARNANAASVLGDDAAKKALESPSPGDGGDCVLQQFVHSGSAKASVVRVHWEAQRGAPRRPPAVWMVSNRHFKPSLDRGVVASANGAAPAEALAAQQASSAGGASSGSALLTSTTDASRSIVQRVVGDSAWVAPAAAATERIAKHVERRLGLRRQGRHLHDLVADFVRDAGGQFWLLQVKALRAIDSAEPAAQGGAVALNATTASLGTHTPTSTLRSVARVGSAPSAGQARSLAAPAPRTRMRRCRGDYCGKLLRLEEMHALEAEAMRSMAKLPKGLETMCMADRLETMLQWKKNKGQSRGAVGAASGVSSRRRGGTGRRQALGNGEAMFGNYLMEIEDAELLKIPYKSIVLDRRERRQHVARAMADARSYNRTGRQPQSALSAAAALTEARVASAEHVRWLYKNDAGAWAAYGEAESKLIEEAAARNDHSVQLNAAFGIYLPKGAGSVTGGAYQYRLGGRVGSGGNSGGGAQGGRRAVRRDPPAEADPVPAPAREGLSAGHDAFPRFYFELVPVCRDCFCCYMKKDRQRLLDRVHVSEGEASDPFAAARPAQHAASAVGTSTPSQAQQECRASVRLRSSVRAASAAGAVNSPDRASMLGVDCSPGLSSSGGTPGGRSHLARFHTAATTEYLSRPLLQSLQMPSTAKGWMRPSRKARKSSQGAEHAQHDEKERPRTRVVGA